MSLKDAQELHRFLAAQQAIERNQNDELRYTLHADDKVRTFAVMFNPYSGPGKLTRYIPRPVPGLLFTAEEVGQAIAIRDALNQAFSDGIQSWRQQIEEPAS